MKRTLLGLVIAVAAAAAGCATPQAVVRLHPQSKDVVWRSGRAIVTGDLPGLRVAVAFDHQDEGRIAFRVEVRNQGTERVDIEPGQLSYRVCHGEKACSRLVPVADPERALIALDVARSEERAGQENDAAAGVALLLLGATATVASATSGSHHHGDNGLLTTLAVADSTSHSIDRREGHIATIEEQKINWAARALRKTTLFPGQGLAGLVYVPVDDTATGLWLRMQAGNESAWFPFKQVVVARPPV